MDEMEGFDVYGVGEEQKSGGFDWSSLLKGAGGLLSGISEGFGGNKTAATAQQQQALEAQMKAAQAEQSAATLKYALIGLAGLVVVGGGIFLATRGGSSASAAK